MTVKEAEELFNYNSWANARVLGVMESLTQEQLERKVGGSYPSIICTLDHLVGGEWFWLQEWGAGVTGALGENPTLPELKAQLSAIEAERFNLLTLLDDSDLQNVRKVQNDVGFPLDALT